MSTSSRQELYKEVNYELLEDLIEDVRSFIDRIQHASLNIKDIALLEWMQKRGEDLAVKVSGYAATANEKQLATFRSLKNLAERLRIFAVDLAANHLTPQVLMEHREVLAHTYEEFLLELKKRRIEGALALAQTNHLKPVNYNRNLLHVTMAVFGVLCYLFILTRIQALAVLGTIVTVFGSLEISRRFFGGWNDFLCEKVFKKIIRPSEKYKVNSATIFVIGLFVIVLLFPKTPVLAATLILGFSDPAASLIGKKWGEKKIYRDKSLIGSLAFFSTAFIVAALFLFFAEPDFTLTHILFVSSVMAIAGTLAEFFSGIIDDNFAVPVVCALVGSLII